MSVWQSNVWQHGVWNDSTDSTTTFYYYPGDNKKKKRKQIDTNLLFLLKNYLEQTKD
jgi:hypothetical protein